MIGAGIVQPNKFEFISELEKNYDAHPVVCYYCGKPLKFKKFYQQFEASKKFCSKKCSKLYHEEMHESENDKEEFSSKTEKIIYTYISLQFPNFEIKHNLNDVFPPYEIDMCVESNVGSIYIEYNGSLHCTRKQRGSFTRIVEKKKINDFLKKTEICKNRRGKMIRLWSEIGLYSNPIIFNRALEELKLELSNIISHYSENGWCVEIVVDRCGEIHKYTETFGES